MNVYGENESDLTVSCEVDKFSRRPKFVFVEKDVEFGEEVVRKWTLVGQRHHIERDKKCTKVIKTKRFDWYFVREENTMKIKSYAPSTFYVTMTIGVDLGSSVICSELSKQTIRNLWTDLIKKGFVYEKNISSMS